MDSLWVSGSCIFIICLGACVHIVLLNVCLNVRHTAVAYLKWSVERSRPEHFCSLLLYFYFLDFKFSNFVCPSELHPLIWFLFKNSLRKKRNIRQTTQNVLPPCIFIVLSIALRLGTLLPHTQAQNTLLQNFQFRFRSRMTLADENEDILFTNTRRPKTISTTFRRKASSGRGGKRTIETRP